VIVVKHEQLDMFVKVAQCGSMQKASEILYTSRQNVSRAILALEEELDVQLYQRLPSGIALTECGEILYKYAIEDQQKRCIVKNMIMICKMEQQKLQISEKENIKICTIQNGCALFTTILSDYMTNNPLVNLHVTVSENYKIEELLVNEEETEYDIILMAETVPHIANPFYEKFFLKGSSIGIIASRCSSLAQNKTISLETLGEIQIIAYGSNKEIKMYLEAVLQCKEKLPLEIKLTTNSLELCIEYISQSDIYLLGTRQSFDLMHEKFREIVFIEFEQPIPINYVMYTKKNSSSNILELTNLILNFYIDKE